MTPRAPRNLPPGHAGTLLRDARKAKGLLQWQVARDTGMSGPRLSTLETGAVRVRPRDAERLAPLLGLDPADLLRAPAPQPRPRRAVAADFRSPAVRSFKEIPASCPCDWLMTFEGSRPSGWALAQAAPGCPHHRTGAAT